MLADSKVNSRYTLLQFKIYETSNEIENEWSDSTARLNSLYIHVLDVFYAGNWMLLYLFLYPCVADTRHLSQSFHESEDFRKTQVREE